MLRRASANDVVDPRQIDFEHVAIEEEEGGQGLVLGGRSDLADAPRPFPNDPPAPSGGSATADEDTSMISTMAQVKPANAAAAQQRAREVATSLPAPGATLLRRWPFVTR